LGTTLHARAGVLAASEMTSISVCAEDVIRFLPEAIKRTQKDAQ
jgi:NAD(P)H-hydrate repair Nnr-like enzyme with NAD(P)H-hydrate dehydratase domain